MNETRLPVKNTLGNIMWEDLNTRLKQLTWDIPFRDTVSAVLFSKLFLNFIGNEYTQVYGISGTEIGTEYIKVGLPDESGTIIKPSSILCMDVMIKSFTNHFKGTFTLNSSAIPEGSSVEEFMGRIEQVFINLLTMVHVEALEI